MRVAKLENENFGFDQDRRLLGTLIHGLPDTGRINSPALTGASHDRVCKEATEAAGNAGFRNRGIAPVKFEVIRPVSGTG